MRAFTRTSLLALAMLATSCTPAATVIATCDATAGSCPKGKTEKCVKWKDKKDCKVKVSGSGESRDGVKECTTTKVCVETKCK